MPPPTQTNDKRANQAFAPEIYIPLVASLYDEARTLLVGSAMAAGAVLLTYWRSGSTLILACALMVAVIAAARWLDMRAFQRQKGSVTTSEAAHLWERRYVVGASASVALLGLWCFISSAIVTDPMVTLVAFSITIAYVIGISGRNFGSGRLVIVQILCAWAPMTAGLLASASLYLQVFALLLVPFFVGLKFISDRLRRTLLNAVTAAREISALAARFDTALNNMPHGLCMFDATNRILVSNRRTVELLGLPENLEPKGMTARQLINSSSAQGTIEASHARHLAHRFEVRLAGENIADLVIETRRGHTLEVTFQAMESGGTVVLIQDVTERKLAEARINHLARFDPLTGLPNRTVLRDRLLRNIAESGSDGMAAILFMDLDQFKQVNDTLGHPRGDLLLQAVADRIRSVIGDADTAIRFGGDEFVILQAELNSPDDASKLAERIVAEIGRPYLIENHEIVVGASVGIAVSPRDGIDADQLLKNADMALYKAKSKDRGSWCFYQSEMSIDTQARRELEMDLRHAMEHEQFELHYQPILDPTRNRISTCEALLRWTHPERGPVSPGEFIPVAEEMGLIVDIGNWVLRAACQECLNWPEDVSVAVNLSPIQFTRSNLIEIVSQTLIDTRLPPHRLELEITETTLLQDTRSTRMMLQELQDLGVRISLDDFGTGYSSLSYLHSFPLDKVKVDRSFLQGLEDSPQTLTLLRGMTRLSAELGLSVTIEGIETQEQIELIISDGSVNGIQGFLVGQPVPAKVIRKLLRATHPVVRRVA